MFLRRVFCVLIIVALQYVTYGSEAVKNTNWEPKKTSHLGPRILEASSRPMSDDRDLRFGVRRTAHGSNLLIAPLAHSLRVGLLRGCKGRLSDTRRNEGFLRCDPPQRPYLRIGGSGRGGQGKNQCGIRSEEIRKQPKLC